MEPTEARPLIVEFSYLDSKGDGYIMAEFADQLDEEQRFQLLRDVGRFVSEWIEFSE